MKKVDRVKACKKKKIGVVMGEFKRGVLKARGGKPVSNRRQAIAIALSVATRMCEKPKKKKLKGKK